MIMIKNFKFATSGTVKPGAKVTVMNEDTEAHTVTADSGGAFDVKVDPGTSVTFTAPSSAGTYKFHCSYHAQMHGTLGVG
jgi:plastocyanin